MSITKYCALTPSGSRIALVAGRIAAFFAAAKALMLAVLHGEDHRRVALPPEAAIGARRSVSDRSSRTRRLPAFSTVRAAPEFNPRDYAATFAALQVPSAGVVLDLGPARLLCADVFERLAVAWTAAPDTVPRLAILTSFERWVMLREVALAALQPLVTRGVRVEVFYSEQASAGYLGAWFAHGQVVHDVPAVVAMLAAHWQPSDNWPIVIDALCRMARTSVAAADLPVLLTQLAALALSCGGAVEAATLARKALFYMPKAPSETRCRALRELGTALICQEQTSAGLALLDQAFTMAAQVGAPDVGAGALCHSGLCALNHGDYAGAERRFRAAIDVLSSAPRRRQLLALAHHSLAVALMQQGNADAEHHARIALALRPDPDSHLAEEDRILLARLRECRDERAATSQRGGTVVLVDATARRATPLHPSVSAENDV